jgi:PKD repeat protein
MKHIPMKHIFLLLSLIILVDAYSQTIFRSRASGNWNASVTWQRIGGPPDADGIPDGGDIAIVVHDVTVASNAQFGELRFNTRVGAGFISLTVNSGVLLEGVNTSGQSGKFTFSANGNGSFESLFLDLSSGCSFIFHDFLMAANNDGSVSAYVSGGSSITVKGDLVFNIESTSFGDVFVDGVSNEFFFLSSISSIGLGSLGLDFGQDDLTSTINFNGTAPQSLSFPSDAKISNLRIQNTAGVSLTYPLTNLNYFGNMIIDPSCSLLDGNNDINMEGDWTNNGSTFTQSVGNNITFAGSAAQIMSGNNNWQTLNLNNSTGLTINSGTQNIASILNVDAGTFNNSAGNVVLLSDASGTAQMANIDAGSYTGNMEVRRFVSKTNQGYVTFASPVSGTTLNSWHDGGIASGQEFIFSGFTGADYPTFSFNNAYDYNEVISGTDRNAGFEAADNITNPTGVDNSYKAHYVWGDAVTYNLSVTGVPNTGSINIPLTMTSAGGVANDGWNLIGNPFPCTIDWEVINNSLTNVEDFYSVYSYETGNFASYEGGIGGLNGGTQYISSSQGIWVQAGAATATLNIDESAKASSQNPNFIKSSVDVMRISISGTVNGYSDEAIVLTGAQYDDNMELGDRAKWYTYDTVNSPTVYTESYDAEKLSVNKLSNSGDLDIPLMAVSGTGVTGTYTLEFNYPATFMANSCIMLEDLHTSTLTDLRQSNTYSFLTSDTTTTPRFIIHLGKNFTAEPVAASCVANTDGSIDIIGDNISGYSFTLLDNANNILSSETASSTTVTFDNLAAGDYSLVSNYSGNCGAVDTIAILIEAENNVTAEFIASADTLLLDVSGDISFTNNSNGVNFTWDFGDGNQSTDQNPNYTYLTAGTYQVTLTSVNAVGCAETSSQTIVVGYSADLSIGENDIDVSWFVDGENLIINTPDLTSKVLDIQIFDVTGKVVSNSNEAFNSGLVTLSIDQLAEGSYIVLISNKGAKASSFKFVK